MAKQKIGKNDRTDLDLVSGLIGNALLSDDGISQVKTLMTQAKDPVGVMAQVGYHAIGGVKDKLAQKGMDVSNKIWTARGGVVDQTVAEIAKLVGTVGKSPQVLSHKVLEGTRDQILDMFHDEEKDAGRPGRGGGGDEEDSGDPADASDSDTPDEAQEANPLSQMMPPGEAGGSHGPDRMPAPQGLLGGMQ